ncbi:queuosine precursor transporter [Candidatus Daviesbacteria bacterium]|nr:queuosine precursor transporter [Candidatus Daviesbacteria bacterium]
MSFLKIEKMDLLIAVYIFCVAVSELMGAKTFPVFDWGWVRLNASVAVFVIPLIFTINDVIVEVYGKERARSIVRSSLVVIFLILIYSLLVTNLPASKRFMSQESAYDAIFGLSARISAASLIAFALSDFLDIYIFSLIREKLGKKALWFRNNASNFISQFIDSAVFLILAFYALDQSFTSNMGFIVSLLIPYWLLRCALSILETPLVYLGVRWLKK